MADKVGALTDKNRFLAALSYAGFLVIIPILFGRDNSFVVEHARQGALLFVFDVIISFFWWIPIVGWVVTLFALCVSLAGFYYSSKGQSFVIPLMGGYAKKITF